MRHLHSLNNYLFILRRVIRVLHFPPQYLRRFITSSFNVKSTNASISHVKCLFTTSLRFFFYFIFFFLSFFSMAFIRMFLPRPPSSFPQTGTAVQVMHKFCMSLHCSFAHAIHIESHEYGLLLEYDDMFY